MALIAKLDGRPAPPKKLKSEDKRPNPGRTADVLNVRKAIKHQSKGGGSLTLAKATEKGKARPTGKSKQKGMRR